MLKKINVSQLRVGMHLKEFCGSWMEHPFWRTAFVITDPKDIERILESSIKEVWIDSAKGLDVAPGETAVSEAESEAQVDEELSQAVETERETAPVPASVEFARAAKICAQSKRAVASMFQEARMGKAVDTIGAQKLVEEITDSVSRNPGALISLARLKTADDYTYMHSVAVCALMIALAKQLGLDAETTRRLGIAGLLHDLGKALMPMDVLNKPGKLTDEEFAIIKTHPEEGYKLLQGSTGADEIALDVVLHHHEKTDGSGYPKRLKDAEISLFAKMGAVCDVLRRDHLQPSVQGGLGPGRITAPDGRVGERPFRPHRISGLRQEPWHLPDRIAGQAEIGSSRTGRRTIAEIAADAVHQGVLLDALRRPYQAGDR
ncbi:MAG: HD-GYP domain-containing protein [Propionivibrio sp.]